MQQIHSQTRKDYNFLSATQRPKRIWAIPAIHSAHEHLVKLHDALLPKFKAGDHIVYLGNYTGYGEDAIACINEILTFRRMVLSIQGVRPSDFTYIKGRQEEMWQKLLQIPFASNPSDVLLWMLGQGLAPTLEAYGNSAHDGIEACNQGVMALTKWIERVRGSLRRQVGHEIFNRQLKAFAHTNIDMNAPLLFVHAGLDQTLPLEKQGDSFWWQTNSFSNIESAYKPFQKVIRGYDPTHKGLHLNCVTATIDDGCGFGGNLVCAGFDQDGQVFDLLNA